MKKLNDHLFIQKNLNNITANIEEDYPLGLCRHQKGDALFLNNHDNIRHLCLLTFYPELGIRCHHYHKERTENLYIVQGQLKAYFWFPEGSQEKKSLILKKGYFLKIRKGLAHAYEALSLCSAIEFSPNVFDINDYYDVPNPFIQ